MAKARSPSYPAISLKDALDKIGEIYERDYQNPIPKAVAASHMGYGGLNGKSLGVLAALSKFGLLEGRGNESRVSDLAVKIIAHPPGTPERAEAIKVAAEKPELFNELDSRFQGGKASDQAIRSYLLTQKFIPAGADAVIRSYRETKQLVEGESKGYGGSSAAHEGAEVNYSPPAPMQLGAAPTEVKAEPFRLSVVGDHIEISARISTPEQVDELMRKLKFARMMIAPVDPLSTDDDDGVPDVLK